ncbi:oxidoreductase [Streptomyces mashuensis]|uniref:Oxidoreductase n=1 Tax=Streptomyces mashuensis TaxID=33904 RepID=A0A919ECT5_9ACTN|nr:oxidoreductase [Streptomyces mashuensis]
MSRLALGTMNFGPHTPEDEAHRIMSRALELGINFFDTADIYGWKLGEGITEQIIGRWLAAAPGRREQVVLATKAYGPMGRTPNSGRLSALHIRRACEASLRRLGTDHLDLFQLHHIDRTTPWEEVWEAVELLVAQGKVVYAGSSNFAGWHLARAQETARRRGSRGLVSEQSVYNLLERTVELEVLPACEEYGIGLLPYSPLQGGLLAGVLRREEREGAAGRSKEPKTRRLLEQHRDRIAAYESRCAELGEDPASVGLAWLLHRPGVTAPVVGPRTVAQLEGATKALSVRLDEAVLKEFDALFPGPGGPAPEAYAW